VVYDLPTGSVSSDLEIYLDFKVIIDALDVLCAQVTRDLFAIAKFMFYY